MTHTKTEKGKDFSVFEERQINHISEQINPFFSTGTTQVVGICTHMYKYIYTYIYVWVQPFNFKRALKFTQIYLHF